MSPLTVTTRATSMALLFLTLCLQSACYFVDNVPVNDTCTQQDAPRDNMLCQDGTWKVVDPSSMMDMTLSPNDQDTHDGNHSMVLPPGEDMSGDASTDMPPVCKPESDEELCRDNQIACGGLMGLMDRCGQTRDVAECGPCGNAEACMAGSCVPECEGQTAAILCTQAGAQCGDFDTMDSCGNARQVDCGGCEDRDVCQTDSNLCVCIPRTEAELCQEQGAQCGSINVDNGCGQMVDANCGGCDMTGDFNCGQDNQCACPMESEAAFCGRLNAQCGMVQGKNNCDDTITVDCGGCANNDPCNADKTCPVCQPFAAAALCANAGLQCGTHTVNNNCGDSVQVTCGSCANDTVCSGAGLCECPSPSCSGIACGVSTNACGESSTCANSCDSNTELCSGNTCECKPETDAELCAAQGATCGSITTTDRCGASRTAVCGACGGGQVCTSSNVCCAPQSNTALCAANNRECGGLTTTDNCGVQRTVNNCGACASGEVCDPSGSCECPTPSCSGVACGSVSNACGNTNSCANSCNATTQTCSGNSCVCQPETDAQLCAAAGATCGSITVSDRCGASRSISCGGCAAGQVCTGSNTCCAPQSDASFCSANNRECGSTSGTDNCGMPRTVNNCGGCGSGESCSSGSCVCPSPSCSGVACGSVSNACGNTTSCLNTCTPGTQTCSGNSCVCQPETDAQLCAANNAECGSITVSDRCGASRTVSCGGCGTGETCNASNQCVCPTPKCIVGTCGSVTNSCGNSRVCSCPAGQVCYLGGGGQGFCEFDCGGNPC